MNSQIGLGSNTTDSVDTKPIVYPPLYISTFFLLLSAVLAVSSLSESVLSLFVSILFWSCVFGVGLFCGYQNALIHKPIYTQFTNTVLVIALFVFIITLATQNIVLALVLVLMWIQAARNFTLSTRRDLYFSFGISFFLLLYAAANSKSGGIIVYMMMYVLAGTFALVANHLDERVSKAQAYGSGITKNSMDFPHSVGVLSVLIIGLATLIYLFVPRPQALHFGAFANSGGLFYENKDWEGAAGGDFSSDKSETEEVADIQTDANKEGNEDGTKNAINDPEAAGKFGTEGYGKTQENTYGVEYVYRGFDESFDIDQPSQGGLSNALLLYVDSPQPLYLRGRVFDTFENKQWRKSLKGTKKYKLKFGEIAFGEQPEDLVIQTITFKRTLTDVIFGAEEIKSLNFPGSVVAKDRYGALTAPGVIREGTVYSVKSYMPRVQGRIVAAPVSSDDNNPYLQLPDILFGKLDQLTQKVTGSEENDLGRAVAIERYLRNEYEYTLDTVSISDRDLSIEKFLFTEKRGHCELFATSMVLMLRSIGVPARLVTGFSATNMNPITGFYEVRGMDSHAWVEAYISNIGWVMFEPTAFYDLPKESPPDTTAEAINDYLENLTKAAQVSNSEDLSTLSTLLKMFKQLGQFLTDLWDILSTIADYIWQVVTDHTLLLSIVVILGVLVVYSYRFVEHRLLTSLALLRLKRLQHTTPELFVRQCYIELENFFARKGEPRSPGCTIQEYERTLCTRYSTLNKFIEAISFKVNLVCYSHYKASQQDVESIFVDFKLIVASENQQPLH